MASQWENNSVMRTAQDLLTELNAADESPRIEAKRSREIGKSIIESVRDSQKAILGKP